MNGRLAVFAVCWSLALPATGGTNFNSAQEAYDDRQLDTALGQFRELAELGHAASQYHLALMYSKGEGAPASMAQAIAWMKLSAASGYPRAQSQMKEWAGQESAESRQTYEELTAKFGRDLIAAKWLPQPFCAPVRPNTTTREYAAPRVAKLKPPPLPRKSVNADIAGWTVSFVYVAKDGRARDVRIVEALPRGAYERAVIRALMLGAYVPPTRDGQSTGGWGQFAVSFAPSKSLEMAAGIESYLNKLTKPLEAGNLWAQYITGIIRMYASEQIVRNPTLGAELIEKSARAGYPDAQTYYGMNLAPSPCTDTGSEQLYFTHQGAAGGIPAAQLQLARDLLEGDTDGTIRTEAAMFWLEQAAAARYPAAERYLVHALVSSERVQDPARAVSLGEALSKAYEYDPIAHELRAYAHAAASSFEPAAQAQEDAITRAKKLHWDLQPLEGALAAYREDRQRDESPLFVY